MLTAEEIDEWNHVPPEAKRDMELMSMTPLDMVKEFAKTFGHPLAYPTSMEDWDKWEDLKFELIEEEFHEVLFSQESDLLKELADLVYVTYGYAAFRGWNLDEALRRVHESNMSKLGADGKPVYREDGKVLKSNNYVPPVLDDLV